jgi:hypothetical protein
MWLGSMLLAFFFFSPIEETRKLLRSNNFSVHYLTLHSMLLSVLQKFQDPKTQTMKQYKIV